MAQIADTKTQMEHHHAAYMESLASAEGFFDQLRHLRQAEQETLGRIMSGYNDDCPAFQDQLPYDAGIFNFGVPFMHNNTVFFNPTVTEVEGQRRLIVRRMKFNPNIPPPYDSFSDLAWVPLDGTRIAGPMVDIRIPKGGSGNEQWEDPRIWNIGRTGKDASNNKLWLTCTNFIQKNTWAHQAMVVLNNDFDILTILHPEYGVNGRTIRDNRGHEKNWTWFFHDDKPYMIYLNRPHTVVEMDSTCSPQREYKSEITNRLWRADLGEPRGGTNPVRVGDEYWCFFHSSQPWWNNRRRYFMGAYAFEAKPPFRITRMSSEPMLKGSLKNNRVGEFPLVVFPGGALFDEEKQEWLVVMGINDCECGWQKLPHEALLSMTLPLQSKTDEKTTRLLQEEDAGRPTDNTSEPPPDGLHQLSAVEKHPGMVGPDEETLRNTGVADHTRDTGEGESLEDAPIHGSDDSTKGEAGESADDGGGVSALPEQAFKLKRRGPRNRRTGNGVSRRRAKLG